MPLCEFYKKKSVFFLLSIFRIESVNVRLLIEHSTGIYSGAMETNASLTDMLHGEGFCGQRLSAVQVIIEAQYLLSPDHNHKKKRYKKSVLRMRIITCVFHIDES